MLSRTLPRKPPPSLRSISTKTRQALASRALAATYVPRTQRTSQHLLRSLVFITFAGGVATLTQYYLSPTGRLLRNAQAEAPTKDNEQATLVFESSRKQSGLSREENRDLISSQHHQVKRSWENPGLYAWGSNSGRVAAPDREADAVIKTPRRIAWFDGRLLRDVKLDRNFGVAVDEKGDLIQWGNGYKPGLKVPEITLKGKDLVRLSVSRDRIIGLSSNGRIYSLPVSAEEQATGTKPKENGWFPFWIGGRSDVAYRMLRPENMSYGEKVVDVEGGLEHAILLTSKGRVFSMASASDRYPTRGQLGVPGLSWVTRPEGAFDQPHEITTLRGFNIGSVACGDYHTLALDKEGRVFTWGDNASGQLGFEFSPETSIVDAPSLLPTQRLYLGQGQIPTITSIAAGGSNSYITVDATRVAPTTNDPADRTARMLGRVTADTFAFGSGIYGNLANNRWTHIQASPTKIPTLSGLFEYDEINHITTPIRLARLSVGATHAAAVMKNITNVSASESLKTTPDDTNWGADVVFWGGNEFYQLGTGKRNNVSSPVYLQPLDAEAELKRAKKSSGSREEHRFHITPLARVKLGDGRTRNVEQRVVCGRMVTGVYSGV